MSASRKAGYSAEELPASGARCDRVIVFRHGRAVSELRKPNLTEPMIVEQCFKTEAGAA